MNKIIRPVIISLYSTVPSRTRNWLEGFRKGETQEWF
jgi:hypothetical protein